MIRSNFMFYILFEYVGFMFVVHQELQTESNHSLQLSVWPKIKNVKKSCGQILHRQTFYDLKHL